MATLFLLNGIIKPETDKSIRLQKISTTTFSGDAGTADLISKESWKKAK